MQLSQKLGGILFEPVCMSVTHLRKLIADSAAHGYSLLMFYSRMPETDEDETPEEEEEDEECADEDVGTGNEPPMYVERPSSARSQDVTHILVRTFRDLFTRDTIAPDTIQYLNTSRCSDDEYHQQYVDALIKVAVTEFVVLKIAVHILYLALVARTCCLVSVVHTAWYW